MRLWVEGMRGWGRAAAAGMGIHVGELDFVCRQEDWKPGLDSAHFKHL